MSRMMIKYHERIESTKVLGPFERAVIWVHGCCFDCPGCIALNFRFGEYMSTSVEEMAEWFINIGTSELTISGGEPFLQAGLLSELISIIRKKRDVGVIVYTGFLYEDILKKATYDKDFQEFISCIDLLIDGPYLSENNNNEPYRGSSNQRILDLTNRYTDVLDEYYYQQIGRQVELRFNEKQTLMVGVPSKDQALIWQNVKMLSKDNKDDDIS